MMSHKEIAALRRRQTTLHTSDPSSIHVRRLFRISSRRTGATPIFQHVEYESTVDKHANRIRTAPNTHGEHSRIVRTLQLVCDLSVLVNDPHDSGKDSHEPLTFWWVGPTCAILNQPVTLGAYHLVVSSFVWMKGVEFQFVGSPWVFPVFHVLITYKSCFIQTSITKKLNEKISSHVDTFQTNTQTFELYFAQSRDLGAQLAQYIARVDLILLFPSILPWEAAAALLQNRTKTTKSIGPLIPSSPTPNDVPLASYSDSITQMTRRLFEEKLRSRGQIAD